MGDGSIGLSLPTVIEAFGSTSLVEVGTNYFLYPAGGSSGPELSFSGAPVAAAQFGSWTPIGAEQTASGYDVAWKVPGADQYSVWATDSIGNYTSNILGTVSGTSSALESLEPVFHQDLNGDGSIGPPTTPIVKNFVTDFGAVADGTTDNMPALDRWLAWGRAQGSTPIELYMPPGTYHFSGWAALTDGLYNVTISGYGAIVDSMFIGSLQSAFDFDHSARIQTVSAGSTSINLVNSADAAKFSPGQWILVSGLELEGGVGALTGYPPNFQFFEYKQITNVSGSVVTLASSLANSYESTWPLVPNFDPVFDQGGPATIYALPPTFDSQQTILGLEVTAGMANGAVFMNGRSIVLDGMKFDGLGPSPSFGQSIVIRNSYIGFTNEVDKVVEYVEYDNDTGHTVLVQSAAPTTLVIKDSTFDQLVGTAQNTFIEQQSAIGLVKAGPSFFGAGESLSIVDSTISTLQESDQSIDPSILTFSNGTFLIPTTSPYAYEVFSWAVPGHEYAIAYYDGQIHRQDDTGHVTTFKILDVRQDATYTYIDTDLGATLPTPTFLAGRPANQYVAYPVMAATETNSGPAHFNNGEIAPVVDGSIDPPTTVNLPSTVIEAFGSTSLVGIGGNYFVYPVGGSSGPELSYSGAPVAASQFGSWTPIGAEQTANGYDVAWTVPGADQYSVWATDSSGNYTSNILGAVPGTSSALESLEPVFHQDLNGDGVIGDPITIVAGATLELTSAYNGVVTFAGSTGTLKLDNSSSFSGTVAGMSGQDTIDLVDINFASAQQPTYSGTNSGGTLTVADGTHTANIALSGQYMASFVKSPDGFGGTLIQDPPPATLAQILTQPQHA